jgi:hypothetical protein
MRPASNKQKTMSENFQNTQELLQLSEQQLKQ